MRARLAWFLASSVIALAPAASALAQSPAAVKPPPARPAAAPPTARPPGAVGEVVVTGERPPVEASIDRRSYSVANDLQAQTGSIADALRNIPSVEVDVQGNLRLRGDPSVTILIDGKPSGQFRGEGRADALQALPADRIERVEVITNPSAEFKADGAGGVINLIPKKARGTGPTGSLRVTGASSERAFATLSGGYNSRDLNISGSLQWRHDNQKQVVTEERSRLDPVTGNFADTRTDSVGKFEIDLLNANGSVDYDLDARTRLGVEATLQYGEAGLRIFSHVGREDGAGRLVQVFDRRFRPSQERLYGEIATSLRRKFTGEGHELVLRAAYEGSDDDRRQTATTSSRLPLLPDAFEDLRYGTVFDEIELKADYTRPMPNGAKLKAGYLLEVEENDFDNFGFRGPIRGALPLDPSFTNRFIYEQAINQAYATYERPFGDVTVLAGLRLEDVRTDLNQVTQGERFENDYLKLFPSLHLSWKLDPEQQLTASYSHRVARPPPFFLNPFRAYIDPLNFRAGNPRLRPQETHSFELGWQYRKAPTFYQATLYYRENEKGFSEVVRDLGGGVFLTTQENVAKTRNGGLELVANGRLSKRLTYNVSSNLFYSELDATPLGFTRKRSAATISGRGNLNWQATSKDFFQLNAVVNGKRLTAQGHFEPTAQINIGWRRKINDRVSLLVTAQDAFNLYRDLMVIDTPVLKSRFRRKADTQVGIVSLVWTFGGGGRRPDPGFEFGGGAPPGVGP